MEKILSIIVPAYNSQDYLERCVNSLVVAGKQVEVILVDDGSLDRTGQIMDEYQTRFPEIIKVIHQENRGHGGAINNGLKQASGKYIKICDSDDWLDVSGLNKLLSLINDLEQKQITLDMILTNYVYDRVAVKKNKVIRFPNLPQAKVFGWKSVHLKLGQYFMMHSVIYRRTLLTKEAQISLPEHVSYEDNIFVFEPLKYVNKMIYFDINLYHYFIGRDDQSVNESVMLRKIDQQLLVNKRMIDFYSKNIDPKAPMAKYMRFYLEIVMAISSIILIRGKDEQYLRVKEELWLYLRKHNPKLYRSFKHRLLGIFLNLPGKPGRKIASGLYLAAHAIYGFN
ncbi:glycosyltransferase family 2 protein [Lactobacillus pasteurii]|uniref:Glycosyltransferase n=1 Tax=Lactobacillus pasteurii DSM 23907 = CRBIP 24.76 TaxID=1423790 RepID=I7LDF5_9LACO|nr:glycosyltransferase family 2 protein [Lactobacillus pasteurii]TDG77307.1 hypothetical protein C5L33_000750 [Lactobacillus pasteurii]CCI84853.1 Glycosyltransferase [Lactobacillus pasteurii DSM 23907 = CRBIP 24.76]